VFVPLALTRQAGLVNPNGKLKSMQEVPDSARGRLFSALLNNLCELLRSDPIASASVPPAKPRTIGTIDWLATEIGCSERQARRYCRQRMVPGAYQVDRRGPWRIKKADARAWIDKIKTRA
jgi:hypothetical protein